MLVMVSEGVASHAKDTEATKGKYLKSLDVDALEGQGAVVWTSDISQAKRFVDMSDALAFWRTQSAVKPHLETGRPNQPLTAYSVSFATPAGRPHLGPMDLRQAARDLERELDRQVDLVGFEDAAMHVIVLDQDQLGRLLAILARHSGDDAP